ncbi:MAG: UvrD-helicase domain-containing protein [Verrucomicrobia bacterium]|nr:UvrD-helicase domain-containing protein [Verrucomicrobiota bacterium]
MSREYVLEPFRAPIELEIDYAGELNEQQYAAVTAVPSPALVIAGAGSGKTRTLTYRVAYLLEQGVPPDRILLLTFTNKAAREMMRRVADLLGGDLSSLWGGTFHSIGNRILRLHAERLGYTPRFTILDREDAEDLLKACISDANIDVKETRFPKAGVLSEVFSLAVNTQRGLPDILKDQFDYFQLLEVQLQDVQERFTARKRAANVMDFDDLLVLWLRLLRDHPDLCERYQRRFQFVLVDEYQDTNKLQSDLIDLLAARHQNVMVVGDDSQSIYSWRGANFQNILQFPQRYPKAAIYKIEINYRSTPEILALANAAIAPNRQQFAKVLTSARKSGMKPVLAPCSDGAEQARFVAQRALELRDEGIELRDMAVLYRSHFHALELQLELTRRNIPFTITSGIRFFEQAHIKDVAAYLKFINNPQDELSFKRLAGLLRGIGGKSADKLWLAFRARLKVGQASSLPSSADRGVDAGDPDSVVSNQLSVISGQSPKSSIRNPKSELENSALHPLASALQACRASVPKKTATAWAQFTATISQLESAPVRGRTSEMIHVILEAGYEEYLQEYYPNYRARLEDLEQLANYALQFKTTEEFLSQLALLTNLEADEDRPASSDDERIRLSTVHQAKGLEFSVVFVIMLCEGLFPAARSLDEEEERRLFYVAITRAKNELYLTYPLIRLTTGYSGDIMQQPSRFLCDLPEELIDEWNLSSFNPCR